MFFVFGSAWEYKKNKHGLHVEKKCPECDTLGEFYEVTPTKYFTLFWLPIIQTDKKKSLLECPNCQERFYIQPTDYAEATKKLEQAINKTKRYLNTSKSPTTSKATISCTCGQKIRVPYKENKIKTICPSCSKTSYIEKGLVVPS